MVYPRPAPGGTIIPQAETGWGALLQGRTGLTSLALSGGVGLHAINLYIATTILPSVVRDIGGLPYYAWNTTVFEIASILGSALSIRLLHRTGPRGAFGVAALAFALGTLACGLAPTMLFLVAARAIQGFSGGVLFALSFAMIRLVFAEPLWPRAMTLISGMWGVATLIGPAVGGVFAEHGVWRGAFFALLPAIALFAALALAFLPGRTGDPVEPEVVPVRQLIVLTAALLAISAASVSADPMRQIAASVAAIGLAALLVGTELRSRQRLLPRGAFAGTLGCLYATLSLVAITVTVIEIFMPLFLQTLHNLSPVVAGYLAALVAAGWTAGSFASAGAIGRRADQAILATPLLTLTGMAGLFLLVPGKSAGDAITLLPISLSLILVGLGVGLGWPHLLTRVLLAADPDDQERAAASLTTVPVIVSALGAALTGMVANLAGLTDPGGDSGTSAAAAWLFAVFAIAPALAIITAVRLMRPRRAPSPGASTGLRSD